MDQEEKLRITRLIQEKVDEKEAKRLVKYLEKFSINTQGVNLITIYSADIFKPRWELCLSYKGEKGWTNDLFVTIDDSRATLRWEPATYETGFDPV